MPASRGTAPRPLPELSVWSSITGDVPFRGGTIGTRSRPRQRATTLWLTRRMGPVDTQPTTLVTPRLLTYAHRMLGPLLRQRERR
jgi:hypothetical protein